DARVLVTASKAEGFGLPVLEAMSAGTPVALSDIPVFHEVAGPHAEYFDPDSPEDAARAIRAYSDDTLWRRRSVEGEIWSRRFDWGRAGEQLLAFLLKVAA